MRNISIFLIPLLMAGCATQRPVAGRTPLPVMIAAQSPTKLVETRYEVGGYREAANPSIRHESHAVFRQTRVPATVSDGLETVSLTSYAPASVAPLPASEELTAELATQKSITTDLRAAQVSIAEMEQRMQSEYASLVRQGVEVIKLRDQLAAERNRLRVVPSAETAAAAPSAGPSGNPDVKW